MKPLGGEMAAGEVCSPLAQAQCMVVFRPHLPQEGATHVPFRHPSADSS